MYWEDKESITVVPEKDVEECQVGAVTLIKNEFTGDITAVGKLRCEKC